MKFASTVKHQHIIVDRMERKSFCSEHCVYAYVRDNTEMVVCCMCRHRMPIYQCVRRCQDDRCFCSLDCINRAERNIDKLLQNDEQFQLDIFNLKRSGMDDDSDLESNSFDQGTMYISNARKAFFITLNSFVACIIFFFR